ncbi:unnamed protein product [Phyllotreta striolata]|uniref:Uncharacterized protein n=1 Tax=Phyllotreta striolata TaxID=444603 RepID=A0A9N9XPN8_PHYSR|nr:unnamed protein product [Phyllotreta striolata]
MATEDNGNIMAGFLKPTSSSNEDLSEYTDADESISAPTEILAEFLSAVMLKDYVTALKYCKLILQYEPDNSTAKEFYPLILEKLQSLNNEEAGSNNDSEDEDDSEDSTSSSTDSDHTTSEESSDGQLDEEDGVAMGKSAGNKRSKGSSEGDGTTGSYSSLEDDEAETDQLAVLAARYQIDNVNLGNGNKIYNTHLSSNLTYQNRAALGKNKLGTAVENANLVPGQVPFGTSSDSESPTEPVSQKTVAMLRAKVVPNQI